MDVVGSRTSQHDRRVTRNYRRVAVDRARRRAIPALPNVVEHLHVGWGFRDIDPAAVDVAVIGKESQTHLFAANESVVKDFCVVRWLIEPCVANAVGRISRIVIRFTRHNAQRCTDPTADDIFNVIISDGLVRTDHTNAALIGAGRPERNARCSVVISATKDEVALHCATRSASEADAPLALENRVVENFVPLRFDRDDFRFSRGGSVCPPDRAVEHVTLHRDLHVIRLSIADSDSKGFKTVVRIATGILGDRVTRSEIAVTNLVHTWYSDAPLRDIRHERNGGVTDRVGSLRQSAIFDRGVKPLNVDPLAVCRSSRTTIKTEMGQLHVSRTRSCSNEVVGQDSAVRVKIQTRQDDPASRQSDFGRRIHHHPSWGHRINKNRIVFGCGIIRDRALQCFIDRPISSAVHLNHVPRIQSGQIVKIGGIINRVCGSYSALSRKEKSHRANTNKMEE